MPNGRCSVRTGLCGRARKRHHGAQPCSRDSLGRSDGGAGLRRGRQRLVAALHAGVRAGMSQGASAPAYQLLAQSLKRFLLGPLHRHGADLQLLCRLPEREALKDGEPESRGLSCRQLIY
ncbi:MAG: hypothetical protein ACI9IO_001746 [Cyanobium sp.]|jgi:hypothetical protein